MILTYALTTALAVQGGGLIWLLHRDHRTAAEERRFLVNHALAGSVQEFVALSASSRPDETVEAMAEARSNRPVHPSPLGL